MNEGPDQPPNKWMKEIINLISRRPVTIDEKLDNKLKITNESIKTVSQCEEEDGHTTKIIDK